MKTMMLVAVAMLALPASHAFSQAECNSSYEACMNSCMPKGAKQQNSCIVGCQEKNNQCSIRYFGQPLDNGANAQSSVVQDDRASEAHDEVKKPVSKKRSSR